VTHPSHSNDLGPAAVGVRHGPPLRSDPLLHITTEYDGIDRVVLHIYGEVDLSGVATLRTALVAALAEGARQIVVDVEEMSFISSDGLRCLVGAAQSAAAAHSTLYVTSPQRIVQRALEVTGLAGALQLRERIADVPSPALEP
jgi:stage II sporulation protein AA (anti-sigma F factor antagonist)